MRKINVIRAENPGRIDVSGAIGASGMAMYVYDISPGGSSSPYHYEYEEEWLLVVEGSVVVRVPDGEDTLERGDVVCFPSGPAGAHKVMNRGNSAARIVMFSSGRTPAVSVYPDSDKIGVWADGEDAGLFFKRSVAVAWGEGEDGWENAG
jgi:uncharacterized cupin superfamily protein